MEPSVDILPLRYRSSFTPGNSTINNEKEIKKIYLYLKILLYNYARFVIY